MQRRLVFYPYAGGGGGAAANVENYRWFKQQQMSTATTQQQYTQHYQQYSSIPSTHHKMDSTNPNQQTSSMNNVQCRPCLNRFLELRNQAINRMTMEYQKIWTGQGVPAIDSLNHLVYQSLRLSDHELTGTVNGKCLYCDSHVETLKKSALEVVKTQFNPFLRNMIPYNNDTNNLTAADQQQQQSMLVDRNVTTRGESTDTFNGYRVPGLNNTVGDSRSNDVTLHQYTNLHQPDMGKSTTNQSAPSNTTNPTNQNSTRSAMTSQFFVEAAKKYNVRKNRSSSSSKHKNKESSSLFPTNFTNMLKQSSPSNPPGLFKYMGRRVDGKVSVMLRVQPSINDQSDNSLIEIDLRKKQISFLQPNAPSSTPLDANQAPPPSQPKYFGFDNIFTPEERHDRISSGSLLDVLHAVINGGDGALVTYGGPGTGKTRTMVGQDGSSTTAGILPCAIAWLYSLIDDCKQRTGARISIRVSAVEVVGRNEELKDLLADQASGTDSIDSHSASPGIYLREDPVGGINLENVSEPQAANKEKAGFYLDAALASRSAEKDNQGVTQNSHMIFTFHIYQYRVEKNARKIPSGSVPQYSGGRSRLHLIDLSYVNQNFEEKTSQPSQAPSHAALGQIMITMLNGNKKVTLFKDSKISRLLRDSIGNQTCRTTVIAHVSAEEKSARKTLQTLNITQKIQRKRRKRNKNYSSSSDQSSCDEGGKPKFRVQHPLISTRAIEDTYNCSDYNTSSAGEDSCDTVIYMGSSGGHLSDRDLTDNERPPSPNTMKIMKLKLSSSEDENTDTGSDIMPCADSTEDLRMRLKTLEECEEKTSSQAPLSPPPSLLIAKKPIAPIERAVNVVAPLVVKETPIIEEETTPKTPDMTKPLTPPPQTAEEVKREISMTFNAQDTTPKQEAAMDLERNVSEKDLRNHEKRIEKLLTDFNALSDDEENSVEKQNRRNNSYTRGDGYLSDAATSLLRNFRRTTSTSSARDGYISAPEYSKKPVQIVRGMVRKQTSLDEEEVIEKLKKLSNQDETEKETCLDDILNNVKTSTPKSDLSKQPTTNDPLKIQPLTVGRFSCIREASNGESPKLAPQKNLSGIALQEIDETDLSRECQPSTSRVEEEPTLNASTDIAGRLQNLNHIITVSSVPNFSVAKKPSLSNLPSSPTMPIRQNLSRDLLESVNKDRMFSPPSFERSYSREDTISVVSAYESDAYDSDALASPALGGGRSGRNPTRLRYRWSTVYEEPEDKKSEKHKSRKPVVDGEGKPARVITSPKSFAKNQHQNSKNSLTSRFTKSPKNEKKSSETPKSPKKLFSSSSSSKTTDMPLSPKSGKSKFSILSPKSERKNKKSNSGNNHSPDKRMSGCSEASSGLDSGIHSQTSSLRSGEEIKVDDSTIVREEVRSTKHKLWPFGRSKSRKSSRSLSGYVSDSVTESRSRRSRFFSRSSKSSLSNTEGYCSGYETSVTEGGLTSCTEDNYTTDNESVTGKKKKKRFLGFRRRSTSDLSSTRGRVKKPLWFDSKRGCQSDTEDLQLKVYQIDDPQQVNKRKSSGKKESQNMPSRQHPQQQQTSRHIEGLRTQNEQLKKPIGYMKYQPAAVPSYNPNHHPQQSYLQHQHPHPPHQQIAQHSSFTQQQLHQHQIQQQQHFQRHQQAMKNHHIQVVTCFDRTSRKVTQI
ncbi:uncharacterized protein [Clytia hemisphaerica]|uniref:uncharacterized protein isoform X3 n=1 Tax=Clytia hemisphaerica TaxID=252671 RepID=UPI0034D4A5A0